MATAPGHLLFRGPAGDILFPINIIIISRDGLNLEIKCGGSENVSIHCPSVDVAIWTFDRICKIIKEPPGEPIALSTEVTVQKVGVGVPSS
jgi:hypothetical protein